MSGLVGGGTGPSGWPAHYEVIMPAADYVAPDNCIGFYAKTGGDVTFTTVRAPATELTFTLEDGDLFPAEVHGVTAWTGTAGDLYAAIR